MKTIGKNLVMNKFLKSKRNHHYHNFYKAKILRHLANKKIQMVLMKNQYS